jgi:CRP-like cAMP-binding protein
MDALTFLMERVPLFAGIPEEPIIPAAAVSTLGTYNKGQTILFKGATVDGLYVMAVGKAGVFVKPAANQPMELVFELGPGDVFGESSIIENRTAGATIKSIEDGTCVLLIPQDAFRVLLSASPEFSTRIKALIDSRKGG